MIGLNSQIQDGPSFGFTLLPNELFTALFDLANQDRLAPAWTLNQMIDDQMDAMFISLVIV